MNYIKSSFDTIITLLLLCCFGAQAQTNYIIDYDIYYDTDFPMVREAQLFVNSNEDKSVFVEMFGTEKPFPDRQAIDTSGSTVAKRKRENPNDYYVVDSAKKDFYFVEDFYTELYKIEDNYFTHRWTIDYKKQKEIDGLKCYFAEVSFRGHKWEAWFTTEIPLPYGPWKLYGLPGLILETKNESSRYHFVATKVSTAKEKFELPDFSQLKKITLQQLLEMEEEKMESIINLLGSDRGAEVTSEPTPKKDLMEFDFEWEEEK